MRTPPFSKSLARHEHQHHHSRIEKSLKLWIGSFVLCALLVWCSHVLTQKNFTLIHKPWIELYQNYTFGGRDWSASTTLCADAVRDSSMACYQCVFRGGGQIWMHLEHSPDLRQDKFTGPEARQIRRTCGKTISPEAVNMVICVTFTLCLNV